MGSKTWRAVKGFFSRAHLRSYEPFTNQNHFQSNGAPLRPIGAHERGGPYGAHRCAVWVGWPILRWAKIRRQRKSEKNRRAHYYWSTGTSGDPSQKIARAGLDARAMAGVIVYAWTWGRGRYQLRQTGTRLGWYHFSGNYGLDVADSILQVCSVRN